LDVGADECHLKQYLDSESTYWGIGLGGNPDQQVNLEIDRIPFPDNSYDCVLCLDVLEHIENIHDVFDDLCRVARHHVIISLPNPWSSYYGMLRHGYYRNDQPMKFYGLPLERPVDRHKWFFSIEEAEKFVTHRANKNNMQIIQMDTLGKSTKSPTIVDSVKSLFKKVIRYNNLQLHEDIDERNFREWNLWVVLENKVNEDS
jgi:hypothetical protein